MEGKQPHYFLITLGEDSWGILIVIPCERMIIENCITATKFKPDIRFSSAATALQEHLKAASSCFANTENLNEQDWF